VDCARWVDAVSALADGEAPGIDERLVRAHVARCAPCRAFQESLGSGPGVAPSAPPADLDQQVVASHAAADRASRPRWLRWGLALLAGQILVLAGGPLVLGAGADPHEARHLGAFSTAYAVGLLVVVARPSRARSMLPVAVVLVAALVGSALLDALHGQVSLAAEVAHLPELLSLPALWLCADPGRWSRAGWRPRTPPPPTRSPQPQPPPTGR
jgi:predicted anti-sigma-YlaC factor YlaD